MCEPFAHTALGIGGRLEFVSRWKILVREPVQRDGHAPRRNPFAQCRSQLGVLRERKRRAGVPVLPRNAEALVADREGHRRKADRHALPDLVVDARELRRAGEIARVVVANGHFHADARSTPRRAPMTR